MVPAGLAMLISGWIRRLALAGVLVGALAAAPAALAVVVHEPNGQFLSIAPMQGVSATSIPRSVAAQRGAAALSSNGNLDYHGGPVVHSSAPYLIFWTPPGETIGGATSSLLQSYFADVAADSGNSANVYGVDRQFTDGAGFADYKQAFSSGQAIVDTQAYPTAGNCTSTSAQHPTCLTDAQLQAEIRHLIATDGLPRDGPASELNQNAPIYFVVLPADVNDCAAGSCASTTFCAYHSAFQDGGSNVLYASIPTLPAATNPKACQADGHGAVQSPNGDPVGDVAIKYMSHEDSETITDPLGTGWWNSNSGNEDGDECNFFGSFNPANGTNPNAFKPTLGGNAAAGTLFNQAISGDSYYIQSEWSNGDINCELRPSAGSISASFSASPGAVAGTPVSFDPSASSSSDGYSSVSWSFGDFGTSFDASGSPPTTTSHAYGAPGTYTAVLTLVDPEGNISQTSRQVSVSGSTPQPPTATGSPPPSNGTGGTQTGASTPDEPPTAAFVLRTSLRGTGQPVRFDASSSRDPDGSITAYAWNFGDGSVGSGASPSHVFRKPGTYTVTLGVADSSGLSASTFWRVTVTKARITAHAVRNKSSQGATILITVNAPGKLSGVGKALRIKQAGVAKLRLKLSGAEHGTLVGGGKLRVPLAIRFAPSVGRPSTVKFAVNF
jgi:PKD repeat protein